MRTILAFPVPDMTSPALDFIVALNDLVPPMLWFPLVLTNVLTSMLQAVIVPPFR